MNRIGIAAVLLVVLVIAGCGGITEPTIEVKGKVMYGGAPVYPGTISLRDPDDEENQIFNGNLNDKGEFVCKVSKPGNYQMSIQTQLEKALSGGGVEGSMDSKTREDNIPDKFKNANANIPKKYSDFKTSGLTFDVESPSTDIGEIVLEDE